MDSGLLGHCAVNVGAWFRWQCHCRMHTQVYLCLRKRVCVFVRESERVGLSGKGCLVAVQFISAYVCVHADTHCVRKTQITLAAV